MEPLSARTLGVTAALVGGAGALQLAAAAIRWAPCWASDRAVAAATSAAESGSADACAVAADHLHDYLWVSAPFEPVPVAVLLAGIASLLLTAVWVIWGIRMHRRPVVAGSACIAALMWLLTAATQALAAVSAGALGVFDFGIAAMAISILATVAPLVAALRLAVLGAGAPASDRRARGAFAAGWVVVALAAVLAFPLVDYVLLTPISGTHDSPVGSAAPAAAALIVAGVAFTLAAAASRRRHDRVRPSAARAGRAG